MSVSPQPSQVHIRRGLSGIADLDSIVLSYVSVTKLGTLMRQVEECKDPNCTNPRPYLATLLDQYAPTWCYRLSQLVRCDLTYQSAHVPYRNLWFAATAPTAYDADSLGHSPREDQMYYRIKFMVEAALSAIDGDPGIGGEAWPSALHHPSTIDIMMRLIDGCIVELDDKPRGRVKALCALARVGCIQGVEHILDAMSKDGSIVSLLSRDHAYQVYNNGVLEYVQLSGLMALLLAHQMTKPDAVLALYRKYSVSSGDNDARSRGPNLYITRNRYDGVLSSPARIEVWYTLVREASGEMRDPYENVVSALYAKSRPRNDYSVLRWMIQQMLTQRDVRMDYLHGNDSGPAGRLTDDMMVDYMANRIHNGWDAIFFMSFVAELVGEPEGWLPDPQSYERIGVDIHQGHAQALCGTVSLHRDRTDGTVRFISYKGIRSLTTPAEDVILGEWTIAAENSPYLVLSYLALLGQLREEDIAHVIRSETPLQTDTDHTATVGTEYRAQTRLESKFSLLCILLQSGHVKSIYSSPDTPNLVLTLLREMMTVKIQDNVNEVGTQRYDIIPTFDLATILDGNLYELIPACLHDVDLLREVWDLFVRMSDEIDRHSRHPTNSPYMDLRSIVSSSITRYMHAQYPRQRLDAGLSFIRDRMREAWPTPDVAVPGIEHERERITTNVWDGVARMVHDPHYSASLVLHELLPALWYPYWRLDGVSESIDESNGLYFIQYESGGRLVHASDRGAMVEAIFRRATTCPAGSAGSPPIDVVSYLVDRSLNVADYLWGREQYESWVGALERVVEAVGREQCDSYVVEELDEYVAGRR